MRNFVKLPIFAAAQPVRDEIVAKRLMGAGKEALQARKVFISHCPRCRRQQQMDYQLAQAGILALTVTGYPSDNCPKSIPGSIVFQIPVELILFHIQSGVQHRPDNTSRLGILAAANRRHNRQVQIQCRLDMQVQLADRIPPGLCSKELSIALHLLSDNRCRGKTHFLHPDGVEICPEFLTVELHIDKPVIVRFVEG